MEVSIDEATNEPLEAVAQKISHHAKKSDEHLISAARLMCEARQRVEAGEAGDTTWSAWARAHIDVGGSRLRELQRIAEAENPEKEIERLRRLNEKRVRKHREKKASEKRALEGERQALIDWATKAPIEHVREALERAKSIRSGGPEPRLITASEAARAIPEVRT